MRQNIKNKKAAVTSISTKHNALTRYKKIKAKSMLINKTSMTLLLYPTHNNNNA